MVKKDHMKIFTLKRLFNFSFTTFILLACWLFVIESARSEYYLKLFAVQIYFSIVTLLISHKIDKIKNLSQKEG